MATKGKLPTPTAKATKTSTLPSPTKTATPAKPALVKSSSASAVTKPGATASKPASASSIAKPGATKLAAARPLAKPASAAAPAAAAAAAAAAAPAIAEPEPELEVVDHQEPAPVEVSPVPEPTPEPVVSPSPHHTATTHAPLLTSPAHSSLRSYTAAPVPAPENIVVSEQSSFERFSGQNAGVLQELEKYRAQLNALQSYKNKWLQSMEEMKLHVASTEEKYNKLETEVAVLRDTTDEAVVEKEIAEEYARDLEERLAQITDQYNKSKLQLEMSRSTDPLDLKGSPGFQELQQQNEKFKDALSRLKDHCDILTADLEIARSELRDSQAEARDFEKSLQIKSEALDKSHKKVKSLLEKAESSSGAEALLESLQERNLKLDETVKKLTEEVADLTTLVNMNDELEEVHQQVEKDLRRTIELYDNRCVEYEHAISQLASQSKENNEMIQKFRARVKQLEGETNELKSKEAEIADLTKESESKALAALNQQLSSAANRERAKTVELELHKLEAQQAIEHIDLLKLFMTDSFFATDYNGLRLLLLLSRLRAKANIVAEFTQQKFRLKEDVQVVLSEGVTVEQWSFASNLHDLVTSLKVRTEALQQGLETCDIAAFQTLGSLFTEISVHETAIDALLQRIKGEGLDPSIPLDALLSAVQHLNRIMATYINEKHPPAANIELKNEMTILASTAEAAEATLLRLDDICKACGPDGSYDPGFDIIRERFGNVAEVSKQIKSVARKIVRQMPKDQFIVLKPELRQQLRDAVSLVAKIKAGLLLTSNAYYSHVRGQVTPKALAADAAAEMAVNNNIDLDGNAAMRARIDGVEAALIPVVVNTELPKTLTMLSEFSEALLNGDYDADASSAAKVDAPWEVRAAEIRTALADHLSLGGQLEKKIAEIKELRTSLKIKEKEISDLSTIAEGSTKRVETLKGELSKEVEQLTAQLAQEKTLSASLNEQLKTVTSVLEGQIRAAEAERDDYKIKAESGAGPRRTITSRSAGAASVVGSGDVSAADLRAALQQVETLQLALFHVRAELARVRSEATIREIADLPALNVPVFGGEKELSDRSKVSSLTNKLLEDLTKLSAAPLVVDISRGLSQKTPALAQFNKNTAQLTALRRRSVKLRTRIESVLAADIPGAKAQTDFSTFMTPEYVRLLEERKDLPRLATVKVPSATGGSRRVTITGDGFQKLHQLFVS